MKRSTAIEIINNSLGNNIEGKERIEIANNILSQLEKLAMIPNTICWRRTNEYSKLKDTDICYDYDMEFKWEPENE